MVNDHHCDDYKIIILCDTFISLASVCVHAKNFTISLWSKHTGAAPYAAPLWHGSEINKQKIHMIPSTEIKIVHIGLLPAGWDQTEATY